MKKIILKQGREKSVLKHHPWIFSGAIKVIEGEPQPGDTVLVAAADGRQLGRAAYSPNSKIQARMWTWNPEERVDSGFFREKLLKALRLRERYISPEVTNAMRLVHAESDGIPGLIVDRYADTLVIQSLTAGSDYWREEWIQLLAELTGATRIFERSDVEVRQLEGLFPRVGQVFGPESEGDLTIHENGLKFKVDISTGQKTGFYVDQRHNRQKIRELSAGKSVLNCFCYTGAFSIYALAGGAESIVSVDSSEGAIEIAKENQILNGLQESPAEWLVDDVFQLLRRYRDSRRSFDLIILDPPKFAPTAAQAAKAARGYKDINLLAFKLLNPGGILATFSCSGGITPDLFQKIVAGAAVDADVEARIVDHLHQGPDHPIALNYPEGEYLKGLICQVG
jgi:23S rRNA (cytosine1962-C5)-methyltransferase